MDKTLTVGIPVYNEEANIVNLIKSILYQDYTKCSIVNIIIYDDCSSDNTVKSVQDFENKTNVTINLIKATSNKGKSFALQRIFELANSDYLVTLDSDIVLEDKSLIDKLISPFGDSKTAITSGWCRYSSPSNIFRNSFNFSLNLLQSIGERKPFYVCWGGFMAFKKEFFKSVKLPEDLYRIDGYLYMEAIRGGYRYRFVKSALVEDTKEFSDMSIKKYAKIQARSNSYPKAYDNFEKAFIDKEITLDISSKIRAFVKTFLRNPIDGLSYIFIRVSAIIYKKIVKKDDKVLWRK